MTTNCQPQPTRKIGFLVKMFPKISETFILQEILELERQGISLTIFSLYPPSDVEVHPAVARVRAHVHYLSGQTVQEADTSLESHQWLIRNHPDRYANTLKYFQNRKEGRQSSELYHAQELAFQLCAHKIDHLHAHFATEPTSVAELAHELTDIPFSFTAHAKDIYLSDRKVLKRKIESSSFVTTCTDYNRQYLENVSSGVTPIHLIYHGLDVQKFQPDSEPVGTQESAAPLILSIGRFQEKKGFPTLLRALGVLKKHGVSFRCSIVGYGLLQPTLEAIIAEEGLGEEVFLVGKKSQDEVCDLYRQARLFVLPCQLGENGDRDGIPNVLIEALAMGVPVISTPVSGIPELITHGKEGVLVPEKDPVLLAQAMEALLDNAELRNRLSLAGRQRVELEFAARTNIVKLYRLFHSQLTSSAPMLSVGSGVEG